MKKIFITYADKNFKISANRVCLEAENLRIFDSIILYSPEMITEELKLTGLTKIKRGGGLWSWKADIIYQTMEKMTDNDIIVYSDAGCTLNKSKEWDKYFQYLSKYDICPLRINQKTNKWTRAEILNFFSSNKEGWERNYQFCATVIILKVTNFTRSFIKEWRNIIIANPIFIKDVEEEDKFKQRNGFIENRHDQAIYSALVYRYLFINKIIPIWEHIEGYDLFSKQAIIATRIRDNVTSNPLKQKFMVLIKNSLKFIFYRFRF